MDWLHSRLSLIILSLLFPIPHSFVIRKRSVDLDFMTDQQLAEAIRERDRDRDRDIDKAEEELNDDEYLYGPRRYHESMPMEMFHVRHQGEDEYENENEKGGQEDDRIALDTDRLLPEEELEEEEEETDEPTTLMDKSELEDLFEKPSNDKKSSLESEEEKEKDNGLQDATRSKLTKEEMQKLFETVEPKTGIRKVITETKVMVSSSNGSNVLPTYEGIKVVEVATEKNDGDGIRKEKETKWIVRPGQNEETMVAEEGFDGIRNGVQQFTRSWLGNLLEDAEKEEEEEENEIRGKRKIKRSEMSTNEEFEEGNEILFPKEGEKENEEEEGAETERNVDLLKAYIKLQTAENEHLEEALNLAIATQVSQTDDYLTDEISHLKMAVQNEEALQTIKNAIKGKVEMQDDDDDNVGDDEDNFDILNEELRNDRQEEVDDNDEYTNDDDDDDISNQQLLNAKLKKFLINSAENNLNGEEDEQEIGIQPDEEDEDDDDEQVLGEDDRHEHSYSRAKVLNPFTRVPLETKFVKMKRSGSIPETYVDEDDDDSVRRAVDAAGVGGLNNLDITDLFSSPATDQIDFCPAIQQLTDDCLAAKQEGLVLDNEAMDLCNRHQLCYYCGSVFGMNADSCDRGYLGESELLCTPKEICKNEAAEFYLIMMKKHRFISSPQFAPYICAVQCVYDYIVGVAERGRR